MLKENDPNKLTIEDVQDKLSGRYDRVCKQIAKHGDGLITDETGMAAYTKQCKGICGKCGEYGHHSRNCTQNERNGFKFPVGNNKSSSDYLSSSFVCLSALRIRTQSSGQSEVSPNRPETVGLAFGIAPALRPND